MNSAHCILVFVALACAAVSASKSPSSRIDQGASSCFNLNGSIKTECVKAMTTCHQDSLACYDQVSCAGCVEGIQKSCLVCAQEFGDSEQFPRGTRNSYLFQCNDTMASPHGKLCQFYCRSMSFPYGVCMKQSNECYCSWTTTLSEQLDEILSNEEAGHLIYKLFDKHREELVDKTWTKIYHAPTKADYSAASFHAHCDKKANTLTIVKVTNNENAVLTLEEENAVNTYIFGGYTTAAWDSESGEKADPKAFVFSLMNNYYDPEFASVKSGDTAPAIRCVKNMGPVFGAAQADFQIDEQGTGLSFYGSYYQTSRFPAGDDKAKAFLAGKHKFEIAEIAVYQHN